MKKIVLRAHWDDDPVPAIESPIGDFFGLGRGEYFHYEPGRLPVGPQRAVSCYFLPQNRRELRLRTREGEDSGVYYNIDPGNHAGLPADMAYFSAEYRQIMPTPG